MEARTPLGSTPDEIAHEDIKWAAAQTTHCGSNHSCLKHGTCLDQPVCKAVRPIGHCAGFVAPTPGAASCCYCVPSFKGYICFCPTRWALHRAETGAA